MVRQHANNYNSLSKFYIKKTTDNFVSKNRTKTCLFDYLVIIHAAIDGNQYGNQEKKIEHSELHIQNIKYNFIKCVKN